MKKLLILLLCISFKDFALYCAMDNYLRPDADENFRQMQQVASHKAIHITVHLNYRESDKTLVIVDKDEKCAKKEDATKK